MKEKKHFSRTHVCLFVCSFSLGFSISVQIPLTDAVRAFVALQFQPLCCSGVECLQRRHVRTHAYAYICTYVRTYVCIYPNAAYMRVLLPLGQGAHFSGMKRDE